MEDGEKELITISPCPICSEKHEYTLKITRSQSISLITLNNWPLKEQPRQKRITRLFTCTTKNKIFQAALTFREYPSRPITSVEVDEK